MHIALFSPAWPLGANPNGIVTYAHWLGLGLQKCKHQVTVFTPRLLHGVSIIDVHHVKEGLVYKIRTKILSTLRPDVPSVLGYGRAIAEAIQRVHKDNPIDIVEMEESFGWCADVQRITGIPVVAKLHGPAFLSLVEEDIATDFAQIKIKAEGVALHKVAAVTSPSQHVRDKTAEKYSIGSGRISHIENPIAPLNDQTKHWRRAHAKDGSILFIGRFDKRKGGDIALTAFEHILRSFPSANLTFVGPDYGLSNARGVPVKFSEFAASSLTSNTCSRVTFLGSQSQAEIEVLRLSAGVVFTASRWENQSYTGLEAMRQACPLVCVDSGGQAEIIEDGKTGLVALSHNPEDLARKIKYLLENPFEAERMGLRAKEYVEDVHAPDRVARLTLDIYNKVLA